MYYSDFLQPCITKPTTIIVNQRPSIVDNIFTNILKITKWWQSDMQNNRSPTQFIIYCRLHWLAGKKIKIKNIKAFTYFKDLDSIKSLNYIKFANVNEL